jgi:hypothetical protein
LAAGVGVLIIVVFAGVMALGHHNNPQDTASLTSVFSKCLNKDGNDSRLCNFEKNYIPVSQASYVASVNVTSPQGTISNLTYSNDGKGNTEVTGSSDGQNLSSTILGGATYVEISGSGWIEYPSGAANAPAQINPTANMNITVGQPNLSFEYDDTESCGSLSCYKYTVSDSTQPSATQYIWFDATGYKLRRWSFDGSTGSTNMNISYQPVTIAAPAPVRVIPAN